MTIDIVPIERRHIAGFRDVLDSVARERRFLAYTEAPPMTQVRRFVLNNLESGTAQFVAVDDGRVVGWCDVVPKPREPMRHSGVVGMGVAASHRGQGLGRRLLATTMDTATRGRPDAYRARGQDRQRGRPGAVPGIRVRDRGRLPPLHRPRWRGARRVPDGPAGGLVRATDGWFHGGGVRYQRTDQQAPGWSPGGCATMATGKVKLRYHCVEVVAGPDGCAAAKALKGQRLLSADAPPIAARHVRSIGALRLPVPASRRPPGRSSS